MDPVVSHVAAVAGRAAPGSLILDPFCGTGKHPTIIFISIIIYHSICTICFHPPLIVSLPSCHPILLLLPPSIPTLSSLFPTLFLSCSAGSLCLAYSHPPLTASLNLLPPYSISLPPSIYSSTISSLTLFSPSTLTLSPPSSHPPFIFYLPLQDLFSWPVRFWVQML